MRTSSSVTTNWSVDRISKPSSESMDKTADSIYTRVSMVRWSFMIKMPRVNMISTLLRLFKLPQSTDSSMKNSKITKITLTVEEHSPVLNISEWFSTCDNELI